MGGVTADAPFPYDDIIILNVDSPDFSACNISIALDYRFRSELNDIADLDGDALVEGTWDPCALWDLNICFAGLRVSDIDIENAPDFLEEWAENYINDQFNDPECFGFTGNDGEEEDSSDTDDEV